MEPSKSKTLLRQHLKKVFDTGATRLDVATKLGFDRPNNISMLLSDKNPSYHLSMNRYADLQTLCGLSADEVLELAFARLDDIQTSRVELSSDTLKFLLTQRGPAKKHTDIRSPS